MKHVIVSNQASPLKRPREFCVVEVPDNFHLEVEPFTVAVVGNSQSLFDKDYGLNIESHDVVIRMNRAPQLLDYNDSYIKSHGVKTDIWCMWRHNEYEHTNMDWSGSSCQMCFWEEEPVRGVHMVDNLKFTQDHVYPYSPSTGLMVLAWLSQQSCTVDVYGFDWKKTPTYTDPERKYDQNEIHNFELEEQVCKGYLQSTGRFKFWN